MNQPKEPVKIGEYLFAHPGFIATAYVVVKHLLPPKASKSDLMNLMLGHEKKRLAEHSNAIVITGIIISIIATVIILGVGGYIIQTSWHSEWKTALFVGVGFIIWLFINCLYRNSWITPRLLKIVDAAEEEVLFKQFESFPKLMYRLAEAKHLEMVPTTIEELRLAISGASVYFATQIKEFGRQQDKDTEGLVRERLKELVSLAVAFKIFDGTAKSFYVADHLFEEAFRMAPEPAAA